MHTPFSYSKVNILVNLKQFYIACHVQYIIWLPTADINPHADILIIFI